MSLDLSDLAFRLAASNSVALGVTIQDAESDETCDVISLGAKDIEISVYDRNPSLFQKLSGASMLFMLDYFLLTNTFTTQIAMRTHCIGYMVT